MKAFFVNHTRIVRHIAAKYQLNPDRVNQTIRIFLGFRGIGRMMKKGEPFHLPGFGTFRPNRKRKMILKRKEQIIKYRNRVRNKK